jgi:RNA polymerase sigma-70 factor (ECF subfamily)
MTASTFHHAAAATSAMPPTSRTTAASPLSAGDLAACLAGDRQAWERLFQLAAPTITAIARTDFGLHREDVEDVVQIVEMKLYERLEGLRDPASFTSWLRRITRRTIIDMLRQKRQTLSLDALNEPTGRALSMAGNGPAEETGTAVAMRLDVEHALASLPPLYREPIVYYLVMGKPQDEIGDLLGRPRSTVATQIQRGLKRLRESLESGYGEERLPA